MVKGASIKFNSYAETVPKILNLLKLPTELKKHSRIILMPSIQFEDSQPSKEFIQEVVKFVINYKNPVAEVFIASSANGSDTHEIFKKLGYNQLAEDFSISLLDLNEAESISKQDALFEQMEEVHFPEILENSFLITLAKPSLNLELEYTGSLTTMLSAYPANKYSGFFTKNKKVFSKYPAKYLIYNILRCKSPEFSILDFSEDKGIILTGLPIETDIRAAELLEFQPKDIPYLKFLKEKEEIENEEQ